MALKRKIQVRRGAAADRPTLSSGEFGLDTDTGSEALYIGTPTGNKLVSDLSNTNSFGDITLYAHRGGSKVRPQNTIAAFDYGVGAADGIEMDVRMTNDEQLILCHDPTLGGLTIEDVTGGELATYDVGSEFSSAYAGERPAFLGQVLARYKGKTKFNIEIKDKKERTAQLVLEMIDKFELWDDCFVHYIWLGSSQEWSLWEYCRDTVFPTLRNPIPFFIMATSVSAVPDYETLLASGLDGVSFGVIQYPKSYTDQQITALQAAGISFHLAVARAPMETLLNFIIDWGIVPESYIVTDPAIVRSVYDTGIPVSVNGTLFFSLGNKNIGTEYATEDVALDAVNNEIEFTDENDSTIRYASFAHALQTTTSYKVEFTLTYSAFQSDQRWIGIQVCHRDDGQDSYDCYRCVQRGNGQLIISEKEPYPTVGDVISTNQSTSALSTGVPYAMRVTVTPTSIKYENVTQGTSLTLTNSVINRLGFIKFAKNMSAGVVGDILITQI